MRPQEICRVLQTQSNGAVVGTQSIYPGRKRREPCHCVWLQGSFEMLDQRGQNVFGFNSDFIGKGR